MMTKIKHEESIRSQIMINQSSNYNNNNNNSKFIKLKGKYFDINEASINVNELNDLILPLNDKRSHFRITIINYILFYHDLQFALDKNEESIRSVVNKIKLNIRNKNNCNNRIHAEVLVTKLNKNELKFELLNKGNISNQLSIILTIENQIEKSSINKEILMTKDLNNNKNDQNDLNVKLNKLTLNSDDQSKINKEQSRSSYVTTWSKQLSTSKTRQSIISDKEKAKILNFIGLGLGTKSGLDKKKSEKNDEIQPIKTNSVSIKSENDLNKQSTLGSKKINQISDKSKEENLNPKQKEQFSDISIRSTEKELDCCTDLKSSRLNVTIKNDTNTNSRVVETSILNQARQTSQFVSFKNIRDSSPKPSFNIIDSYNHSNNFSNSPKRPSLYFSQSDLTNQKYLKSYFENKQIEWENVPNKLIDSHCHFDMLFNKIGFYDSIDEYFEKYKHFYLKNFEACINVICDPIRYSTMDRFNGFVNKFSHEKIYFTVGCHPHFADYWTDQIEEMFYDFIKHTRVVAVGECGLDISKKNNVCFETQVEVFRVQLSIARKLKIPVVIHCRETEEEVYEILKESLNLNHRIHLHCFTGSWQMAKKYLDTFQNLCIGVTSLVTFPPNKISYGFVELVKNIPVDRLLLETDAPYFLPQFEDFPTGIECCHPGFVYTTAESVANIKNVSLDRLITNTRDNVRKIYRI